MAVILLYLLTWPVPIEPVEWNAPEDAGYSGDFALNDALVELDTIDIAPYHGPEDIAVDPLGNLYAGTESGEIIRIDADREIVWEYWNPHRVPDPNNEAQERIATLFEVVRLPADFPLDWLERPEVTR